MRDIYIAITFTLIGVTVAPLVQDPIERGRLFVQDWQRQCSKKAREATKLVEVRPEAARDLYIEAFQCDSEASVKAGTELAIMYCTGMLGKPDPLLGAIWVRRAERKSNLSTSQLQSAIRACSKSNNVGR